MQVKACREILPLHLLHWDLGPLSFQYSMFCAWQRCLASSRPRGMCLLTEQQGEKKHTGRWCLPVWLMNLPGLAGLCSASTWGSDKASHYLSFVLTVHVLACVMYRWRDTLSEYPGMSSSANPFEKSCILGLRRPFQCQNIASWRNILHLRDNLSLSGESAAERVGSEGGKEIILIPHPS